MNWYIGQPIVAIVDHPDGKFKKGDEFTIKGLVSSPCSCKTVGINIGMKAKRGTMICMNCFTKWKSVSAFYCETRFAPLDTNISELTEILECKLV